MTETALLIGIVFVSFGFLLVAHSVIDELAKEAKTNTAKSEEPSGASLSERPVSAPGSGAIRPA